MFGNERTTCSSCFDTAVAVIVDPLRTTLGRSAHFVCPVHLQQILADHPSHRERLLSGIPAEKRPEFVSASAAFLRRAA